MRTIEDVANQAAEKFWHDRIHGGRCRAPFAVDDAAHNPILVPCGKCLPCYRRKRNIWIGRLLAEGLGRNGQVQTLTYTDDQLPEDLTPEWIDGEIRAYVKRLRRHFRSNDWKYYITAQLGENTLRFHLHAVIIPPPGVELPTPRLGKNIDDHPIWQRGGVRVDTLHPKSVGYVVSYLARPGKGTVRHSKSKRIGEAYFRDWLARPPLPLEFPGTYTVPVNDMPQPFPMDRTFRQIALEAGRDLRGNADDAFTYRKWIEEGGLGLRSKTEARDRELQAEILRTPKMQEHPEVHKLRGLFRAAGKRCPI